MRRDSQDFAEEWRERTLTDAKRSLHNELEKLIKTANPGQQGVSAASPGQQGVSAAGPGQQAVSMHAALDSQR